MTVIGERMLDLRQVRRVFDTKPWAAHLYMTEQCNLDCHYCNEFNNSIPHPALADLKKWMDHIRKLDVMRLGHPGRCARCPRRSRARPRLARCKCERAAAPLSRAPGETEAQRPEDSLDLEPFRLPKEDAAAGTGRMDLHRGL